MLNARCAGPMLRTLLKHIGRKTLRSVWSHLISHELIKFWNISNCKHFIIFFFLIPMRVVSDYQSRVQNLKTRITGKIIFSLGIAEGSCNIQSICEKFQSAIEEIFKNNGMCFVLFSILFFEFHTVQYKCNNYNGINCSLFVQNFCNFSFCGKYLWHVKK